MVRAVATLVLIVLVACGGERGAPRVRPLPEPDPFSPVRGTAPRSQRIANYKIDAQLDPVKHVITATQTLRWKNTGATIVDRVPFHLYLNAFKNDESLFMRTSHGSMRSADQTTWGWIDVTSVQIGGTDVTATFKPDPEHIPDTTVYWLPAVVEPGAEIAITMKFTAQLPEVWARTGYKGEFHLVGQWFPKIGVRTGAAGAERWECAPFHAFNEFFADFGEYDVSITVPNTYVVAATGVLTAATEAAGGTRTYTYRAEDVHDFAWMADPYMELHTAPIELADGSVVAVRVYARPEQAEFAQRHLEAATGAIERFSAYYIPYPWPVMTVIDPPVDAAFGAGGMEYPTFVTTLGDHALLGPGLRVAEYTTVHEVGHNWFQGILASNEPVEAWLDEGVNTWADAHALADMYGPRENLINWMGWKGDTNAVTTAIYGAQTTSSVPITTPAARFPDAEAYSNITYFTTARALTTLERIVGEKKFAAAMKAYATEWAFMHPTGADFIATLTRELGQDLSWFFGPVFQQIGGLQLAIRDAGCQPAHSPRGVFDGKDGRKTITHTQAPDSATYRCSVTLTNTGPVRVPVDVELRFVDGGTERLRWEPIAEPAKGTSWRTFDVARSSQLEGVWVDPDGKLALANPIALRYRLQGDGSAALRAGAWTGAAVQTLMQVIGP